MESGMLTWLLQLGNDHEIQLTGTGLTSDTRTGMNDTVPDSLRNRVGIPNLLDFDIFFSHV